MQKILFLTIALFSLGLSKAQIINTIAGNGYGAPLNGGYSGDGGQATAAELNWPFCTALDGAGNIYIADDANNRIRKVNTSGIIITLAGNGTPGYSGDGGQATAAELYWPSAVTTDASGNIYIVDQGNNRVRIVTPAGIITTLAGNGVYGYSGDGGPATAAEFRSPIALALDNSGNMYVADDANSCIRKINTAGIISTIAGNGTSGFSGDGGQATAAELDSPYGVATDNNGNVYIADTYNERIRMVVTSGIISTIAGNGNNTYTGDGGQATASGLSAAGLMVDPSGNLYIADEDNSRIRIVNSAGIINTYAGDGIAGFSGDGGQATAAEMYGPNAVTMDIYGNLYITDYYNQRIRKINNGPENINKLANTEESIIYPNPSNGVFTILNSGSKIQNPVVEIYNVTGERVFSSQYSNLTSQCMINISNQPAGIYFYRVVGASGDLISEGKLVINN